MRRPTQAVILAGGRGSRLGPLTEHRPKPMVEFHGRPFLEYLIELLRDQGFDRILLLLGYLAEVVQHHVGDGRRLGVSVEYSVSAPEDLTVRRVQLARSRLDPCFLLMYCDNYWPMQFDRMWDRYCAAGVPLMTTVYTNEDRYSRDTVELDDEGYIVNFDRTRTAPRLKGIEISYAIVTAPVLDLLPDRDELFEQAIYPPLARQRRLLAYPTDHRYYSVGCLDRLPVTEAFLARRPTLLLDRDGVLNRRPAPGRYVRSWSEFAWVPGALDALRLLKAAGWRVIVITNQAGIARGELTQADLDEIHARLVAEARAAGGDIDAIYCCPHDWNEGCACRKPRPGLLFRAQRDHHLDLTRTPFIGDDERDAQAAEAAGCRFTLVGPHGPSLLDHTVRLLHEGERVQT
jgi:histidinol-phosphate phosphatase family protein